MPSTSIYIPSSSNSCDEIASLVEENSRLKAKLANDSTPSTQDKMSLDVLLSKQKVNGEKRGIGYVPKSNKKKNEKKKKALPAPSHNGKISVKEGEKAKDKGKSLVDQTGVSGPSRPESPASRPESPASRSGVSGPGFAGVNNPHYVLCRDYYGDVCAKFVGPFDGYIDWSIWVPKTLVTNMRGPIKAWVPKSKN